MKAWIRENRAGLLLIGLGLALCAFLALLRLAGGPLRPYLTALF